MINKKLLTVCKYLDYNKFRNATQNDLKNSLQLLSNYFSTQQGRPKIKINFDYSRIGSKQFFVGECYLDEISIYPFDELTNFESYVTCFDTIIHECFHTFEYYLMHLPKDFVDEILWQRIVSYNAYEMSVHQNNYDYYRFNDFELDAYRFSDFFLYTIYKSLKKLNCDVEKLQKYILEERKFFVKKKSAICNNFNIKKAIDFYNIKDSIMTIRSNEEIDDSISDKKIFKNICEGSYIHSIFDNKLIDIPQSFIDKANENFKNMMPHLYSKNKSWANNEFFFELEM